MDIINEYIRKLSEVASLGDAREESYYPSLKELFERYAQLQGRREIQVTTLPKKTEAGNPDFRVWDGKQHIIGYIEAKNPQTDDLDPIEFSEQVQRYLHTFPNLILTNFFEFRLYRNGTLIEKVRIANPFLLFRLGQTPPLEKADEFINLLEKFFSFSLPEVRDARALAEELAKRTRFLKNIVFHQLTEELREEKGPLFGFYTAFKEYLLKGINPAEFADLYSQTITYGLFAARTRSTNSFNRRLAYDNIPKTIGILRDVFRFISLGELHPEMEWIIDDISEVLALTDVDNILHQYFREGKGNDPIVHFYETFLAVYDPEIRRRRGVYYTPEPVVSYIVRSVQKALKDKMGKALGLADEGVTVLDPAAGTLTFLAYATRLLADEIVSKYGVGFRKMLLRGHILQNFYAFELMMAPYTIGHLKMSLLFEELGYKLEEGERFKLYLTNALEMEELAQTQFPGMASLSEESHLAGEVKREKPILVIMGNPPYSTESVNRGEWISREIKAYYRVNGKPLREKNTKPLQDDYVKFIRFAQWKIEQNKEGVLGFITNHNYLDNPTFRGMRQSLMNTFDEIYILNLHGNSLKKERCPDGSKDENVFDIRPGVAIALMIKRKKEEKETPRRIYELPQTESPTPPHGAEKQCKVYYADLWGLRKDKYDYLLQNDISTTIWQELTPKSPLYFFIPKKEEFAELYEKFVKITDIFPIHNVGVDTGRDRLTIKWTREEVWQTVLNFSKMEPEMARMSYKLGEDTREWKVELAQKDLRDSGLDRKKILPILYRPFDVRYTYYTGRSKGFHCRPRPDVMSHMFEPNLGLITTRRPRDPRKWRYAFITDKIISGGTAISSLDRSYLFPLYIYRKKTEEKRGNPGGLVMLFERGEEYKAREANISQKLINKLRETYGVAPTPEGILAYIYAVLYSNIYRTRYDDFLRADFPRIPFTGNKELFEKIAHLGMKLIDLHLLRFPEAEDKARLEGEGDGRIREVRFGSSQNKVYINEGQFFANIKPEVWEYEIGTYRVCDKWLRDRIGRELSLQEAKLFLKIVKAIEHTIKLQEQIDVLYPELEKELLFL